MLKHFFASLLLIVSLTNAAMADIAEFFPQFGDSSTDVVAVSEGTADEAVTAHESGHHDCDQGEHARTHQCHVGHCQFTASVTSIFLPSPGFIRTARFGVEHSLQSTDLFPAIKPPRA